jgi:hypothetical protein
MSEHTIEQCGEARAVEDELANQQLGHAYRDEIDEEEEHRREFAEEEDAE